MSVVYLLGHPVAHSLSPAMHNAAFAALGLPHRYELLDVTAAELPGAVDRIRSGEVLGANVTIPHKAAAARSVDRLVGDAERLGVANTLVRDEGRVVGHNTDVYGFDRMNAERGFFVRSDVLVLGAGGGARAVVLSLLRSGNRVTVAARETARAEALAGSVRDEGGHTARAVAWGAIDEFLSAAVVNTTPLGLAGEDPLAGHRLPPLVADIVPRASTPLLERARAEGSDVLDGLGMLLHQAAASFRLWTGREAPIEVMRAALHASVS
jgi:shikimate dehydrogenase